MFLELDNYTNYEPTTSCFLDGRYIPIVLENVEEFHKEPIYLHMEFDQNNRATTTNVQASISLEEGMNIIRVIILSAEVVHSALVWIDTRSKTITFTDVRVNGFIEPRTRALDNTIEQLLKEFFSQVISNFKYFTDIAYVDEEETLLASEHCHERYGFCNAYVIKQVMDYIHGEPFDSSHIMRFAAAIEDKYAHLLDPDTEPEVEYQLGAALGLGLLGGLAIGSVARPRYVYPAAYPAAYPAYPAYRYPAY